MKDLESVERCRVCGSASFEPILDLGAMPLANTFVRPDRVAEPEPRYPLELVRCLACGLAQLTVVVSPEIMFRDYAYSSSYSPPLITHFTALADELISRYVAKGSLVVELGSNDGVLLRPLADRGARVLGIEPAANLAAVANAAGVETWNEFFGAGVAGRAAAERGRASAIVANNVLAHIDDLGELLTGIDALLADDGVFVAEVPYLRDLLSHVEYDTIYHEHLSYFALGPLAALFERGEMALVDVARLPIHGGSIRILAARRGRRQVSDALRASLEAEADLMTSAPYAEFARRVVASRMALRGLLDAERASGHSLGGYGATAKGNTLLSYCGLGPEIIPYIADTTPYKQGLLTPGTHIPVVPEAELLARMPDRTLLLAWNYAEAILERRKDYLAAGGRFIHPIPLARLL